MEETYQFRMEKDESLSINQLRELMLQDYSAISTSHVGNLERYHWMSQYLGFPGVNVDHNVTGRDETQPQNINRQSRSDLITNMPLGTLACRTPVSSIPEDIRSLCDNPKYIDELHIQATRGIIQNANIVTNTDYIRKHEGVYREIVRVALEHRPKYFNKLVLADGRVDKKDKPLDPNEIGRYGEKILQLSDDPRAEKEAPMLPNIVNALAICVVEAMKTEKPVVYHLADVAMYGYIGNLSADLNLFYSYLKSSALFKDKLPEQLTVKLVPIFMAEFVTTNARRSNMETLVQGLKDTKDALSALNEAKGKLYTDDAVKKQPALRQQYDRDFKEQQRKIEERVVRVSERVPELFSEPCTPNSLTQYDLQVEGGAYVPTATREMSMAELKGMSMLLRQMRKRAGVGLN